MLDRLTLFLTDPQAGARRALLVTAGSLALALAIYLFGKFALGIDERTLEAWFESMAESPWALPATVVVFVGLAFLGAPQFLLFAAAVVAFGAITGSVYSWIGTMAGAPLTFWLGRVSGARLTQRYGGERVLRISRFVGRNGFWTSFAIRNVPSAPFIVVNMALGMSHAGFWPFMAGTGLGIIPKILLVAFAGQGLAAMLASARFWEALALVAAGSAIWAAATVLARRFLRRKEARGGAGVTDAGP